MERKLGIDWEHEPEEEISQGSRFSLQTNEEVDKAFPELRSTLIEGDSSSYADVSGLSLHDPKSGSGPKSKKNLGSFASSTKEEHLLIYEEDSEKT